MGYFSLYRRRHQIGQFYIFLNRPRIPALSLLMYPSVLVLGRFDLGGSDFERSLVLNSLVFFLLVLAFSFFSPSVIDSHNEGSSDFIEGEGAFSVLNGHIFDKNRFSDWLLLRSFLGWSALADRDDVGLSDVVGRVDSLEDFNGHSLLKNSVLDSLGLDCLVFD